MRNFNSLSPFHPYHQLYFRPRSRTANFAFNPWGLVSKISSIAPALKSGFRTQRPMCALGSNKLNRTRGGIQNAFGKYLDDIHTSALDGAATRALYKGGRSATRAVKRMPGAKAMDKLKAGTNSFGKKALSSLRRSASGAALDVFRNPVTGMVPGLTDAAKMYRGFRPKGTKLPKVQFPGRQRIGSVAKVGIKTLGI